MPGKQPKGNSIPQRSTEIVLQPNTSAETPGGAGSPSAHDRRENDRRENNRRENNAHEFEADTTDSGQRHDDSAEQIQQMIFDYHAALFGFAYRLTGNRADAEDMVQQTFLNAVENARQIRDRTKIKSWLMVTLKNCFLKSRRRRRPLSETSLQVDVSQLATCEVEHTRVDGEALQLAINQLPDDHRLILAMFYYQQLSYREIANTLGVKIGTVMSRLARAKARLRGILLLAGGDCHE